MALATSISRKLIKRSLCEAIIATPQTRVDRATCTIYGVKILGRESGNRHGLDVDGTLYETEAMEAALPRYRGKKVNINHPPRSHPGMERDANDRSGKFVNVYLHEGELYGDLKLLPSHPMTARIMDAAEDPDLHDCFAMSHNAVGRGEVRNVGGKRMYVVSDIPEVRSVDVVADGGTNVSLFESAEGDERPFATQLLALLEAAPAAVRSRCVELLGPNAATHRAAQQRYQRQLQEVLRAAGKKANGLRSVMENTRGKKTARTIAQTRK